MAKITAAVAQKNAENVDRRAGAYKKMKWFMRSFTPKKQ